MSTDPNQIINSITSLPEDTSNPLDTGNPNVKTTGLSDFYKGTEFENSKPDTIYKGNVNPYYSEAQKIDLSTVYTDPTDSYLDYDVPLDPFAEWNDIRAENQNIGEKIMYGGIKMVGTGVGAILENTAGVIGGLGSMASGGTYSNNPIGRGVDEMNEWLAENLPHYYTQRELDPDRAWYDNLGDANFWTDKFANGVGYLLGSIGTIALTGGSGLITRGAAAGLAASESIGTIAGAISKGEKIKNIYNASKIIKSGAKLSDDIATQALKARGLNAIKNIEIGTMMSMGEASVEAREKSKSYIEERFTDWEENNPGKIARRDMPLWMQEEIYNDARSLENATFGLNLALLVPTNLMQASVLLGNKFLGKITADKIVGDIVKKEGKFIAAETASGISGKLSRLNDIAAPIYKSKLTEAFQEGAQFFIGAAGSEYFKNKFDTGVEDLGLAISKGLSQTLGSADGQESMLIGALIGGFGGAISTTFGAEAAKRKLTKENTNRLVQLMNSSIFIDVKNEMEKSQEASRILSALKASREIGNDILSDQLMKEYIFMRASKLREVGAEDLGITEIDDLKNLSDEEFSKRIGLDPAKKIEDQTGGKSKNMLIDDYIKEYKKAIKLDEDLEAIVESMNPSNFGAPDLLKSKDRKYRDSVNRYYNSKLKTILMSNLTSIDTIDTSLDETLKKLKEISPEFEAINVDDLLLFVKKNKIEITSDGKVEIPEGLTTTEITDVEAEKAKESGIKETDKTKEKFKTLFRGAIEKSKNYDPLKKDKFENYINTFLKLAASREEAIAAFEELRRNPEARQTAILAKEAKIKESKAINDSKDADVIIDKARSTADLEELINNENLSPEMKAKVKKKYDDLRKVEDDYFRDFVDLPDNVLIEDLLKNIEEIQNANPQMALALLRVLESRRSETSEEKAKKQTTSYEDDINKKFETEPAADTKNTTKYKNNINVSSAALNKIFINGNLYDIKYSDITSAVVLREDSTVESVTLHLANTGQEVIFKDSQDNPIATEIAEVLFTMAAANTSKDSSNTTIEDIERASEVFYNKFITTKSVIDNRIENVKKSQDSALISGMIESIDQNINQMSLFTESIKKAYIANSQDIKNSDIYAKLKSIVDEYLVKKGELQKIYRTLNKLEDTINNQNVAVKNLSEQEEKELQNEINKLQKEIDEIQDRLQAIDEELSETTDEAIAQALSEEAQSLVIELNSKEALRQTKITLYENRKSSKAGPDVSDPTKSPEDTEEQGPDGQGEGDSEVLKDETDTTDLASLIKESLNMSGSINLSPTDEGEEVDTTTDNPISNYSPSDEPPIEDTKNPINNLNGEILNVRIINTEYQSPDEDYDYIIVDKNGKPIPNEQYETIKKYNKVNGDTINIKQNLLTSESEVPTGSKLTFVFRDTDWWKANKTNTEEDWKRAPIYVYINYGEDNEQAVGMLEAFREGESEITSDRKKIYEALQSGKKVESILGRKLEGKEGKTIANAVDKDGNTYFYDIYTDPVVPPNLVIKTDSDGWVQVTGPETFSDAELAEFLQRTADNGSVGLVTFDSSGNPQLLKLQTEKIGGVDGKNDYAYKIIEKLIKENNFSELSKIIGFNLIKDSGEFDVNKSLVLEENINTGSGSKYLYTFYHDAAESYVRVSGEELSKALNGKTFKYSFVDIESEYTDNNKLIYNIVTKDKDNDDYKKYAKTIVTNFKNKVKNKRFQVDINQFGSNEIFETPLRPGKLYNSYLEYLTEEDPNIKALGHKSILKSDIYINELGSPNYNIGIEFKSLIIDGKLQDSNETYSPFSENSGEMDSEDTPQSNDTTEETGESTSNPYAAFGDELFEEKTEDSTKQTFESKQSFEDKAETAEDASNPTSEETGKKVFTEEEAKEFTSQEDKLLKELKRVYDEEVVKDSKSNKPKMHVDPKTQEEDAYIIKPFDETFEDNYRRITKLAGEPFTGDPKLRDASTKVGNTIHDLAEKILLKLPYERPQNLSRVAFLEFKVEISKVARTIQSRKETIIATEMVVYSKKPQFAGKFDILVKTQKGGYHIYDIKTGTQKGLNDYDKTHTNKDTKRTTRSKRDQHGAQLSLYAYALRGMADRANIPINKKELITGSVLYFPLEYTETGEITKVLESKEKKFILNFDAYKVIKDKPSFEIKKDSTGDPSLDNAGTKKGGNTAKSNRGKEKEDTDEESKTKSKGTKSGVASKKFKSPDGSRSITLQEFSNILDYYLDNNEVDANLTETIKKIQKDIKTSIKNDEMDNSRGLQEFVQGVIDSLQTSDIKDLLGSNGYQIPSSDDFTNKLDEYIDNEEIRKICNS